MRRCRRWLIPAACLAVVIGGSIAFYYRFVDTAYVRTEFYQDTAIARAEDSDSTGRIQYSEQPGRVILALSRGEPHGIITTAHDWWENLAIDIPIPSDSERIDLSNPDVRIVFWSYDGRQFPSIGEGGVRGYVEVESFGSRRVVAAYDIVVDGVYPRFKPEHQHRDVVFRGRSTFRLRPRPDEEHSGYVWPPFKK